MALVLADRVQETTTTTGTGTLTLAGAVTGYQSFSTAIGNGNTTYYTISSVSGSEWEVGIGTYTSAGNTLSRDTVLSSSAGGTTKVTFSAGTKNVFVTYPAEKSVNEDASGNVGIGGTPSTKLDVAATGGMMRVGGASGNNLVQAYTGSVGLGLWAGGSSRIYSGGGITFSINGTLGTSAPTGYTDAAVLTGEGRFLIGTTTGVGNDFTSIRFNSSTTYSQGLNMVDSNASANGAYYQVFRKSDDTNIGLIRRSGTDNAIFVGGNSYLALGSGDTERARIDSSGNVGIGTSSPAYRLDVVAADTTANLGYALRLRHNTTASAATIQFTDDPVTVQYDVITSNTSEFTLRSGSTRPFTVWTNGSERLRIGPAGQIGLGGANYGTSGQVLTSNGSGSAPTWQTPSMTQAKATALSMILGF